MSEKENILEAYKMKIEQINDELGIKNAEYERLSYQGLGTGVSAVSNGGIGVILLGISVIAIFTNIFLLFVGEPSIPLFVVWLLTFTSGTYFKKKLAKKNERFNAIVEEASKQRLALANEIDNLQREKTKYENLFIQNATEGIKVEGL
jgi:hypothetical protein